MISHTTHLVSIPVLDVQARLTTLCRLSVSVLSTARSTLLLRTRGVPAGVWEVTHMSKQSRARTAFVVSTTTTLSL